MKERMPEQGGFKEELWRTIFLADTKSGKIFDVALLVVILASVLVVMLESVGDLAQRHRTVFAAVEWVFTAIFTLEYATRIWVVRNKSRYLLSFYGIVDLLAVLPAYISLFLGGAQYLVVTRMLRLLRVFRILKMPRHIAEADMLLSAVRSARAKIGVFLFSVAILITIEATIMYLIEGGVEGTGFTSIPQSIYWAVVTFTTVGYGDIAPVTTAGKVLASIVMLTGYSIIAVPTGIISAELYERQLLTLNPNRRACPGCGKAGHSGDARYCQDCGSKL
ncbi:ion transporter [soil metagenome]